MQRIDGHLYLNPTDRVEDLPPAMGHDWKAVEYHGYDLLRCPCGTWWEAHRKDPRECCLDKGEKAAAESGVDEAALLAAAETGRTFRDISKEFKISQERVSSILRRLGYRRGRGTTNHQARGERGTFVKDEEESDGNATVAQGQVRAGVGADSDCWNPEKSRGEHSGTTPADDPPRADGVGATE